MAKAAVAEAQAMTGYVKIVAPFDGVVTRKLADVGDLAAPGKPLIEIEDRAGCNWRPMCRAIAVQRSAGRATGRPGGYAERRYWNRGRNAPTADPASRTFRVKLDLPAARA